jgi:hypothetical protein
MKLGSVWSFIAGDSRRAPLAVAAAVAAVVAVQRVAPGAGAWTGALFVAIVAAGLIAGVFEKPEGG